MTHVALHSKNNTEKIDRSQEIEVWPEMRVYPSRQHVWQAGGKHCPFWVFLHTSLPELQTPISTISISGIETILFYPC